MINMSQMKALASLAPDVFQLRYSESMAFTFEFAYKQLRLQAWSNYKKSQITQAREDENYGFMCWWMMQQIRSRNKELRDLSAEGRESSSAEIEAIWPVISSWGFQLDDDIVISTYIKLLEAKQ